MTNILRDVRYGGRMLAKHPGHTVAALLALGLGIGLTTTVFSIDYGALLRGLPFERSDRIMAVYGTNLSQQQDRRDVFPLDYLDLRRRQTSFESLAAYSTGTINLSGDLQPERFDGAFLTADSLGVLRVRPLLGRGFLPGEDAPQAEPVVILGYGIWRTRYGGDPKVIGRAVRVNGQPATIVGVMPEGFKFPARQDVWVPKKIDPGKLKRRDEGDGLQLFGRLKEGVTAERAQIELTAFAKAIEKEYLETNRGVGVEVVPFAKSFLGAKETGLLLVMLGFGFVVLFIACANVASLMVAKASLRTRELAIRSALGAGRRRVVVQLLVESTLLSLGGAILGVVLAAWGVGLFNAAIYSNQDNAPPFWIRCEVDGVALAFTLGITVLAGVLSGLMPALQASRADLNEILKDEGRGSTSLRIGLFSRFLVISELAVCCMLLVGAGLMVKSVVKLQNLNLGFSTKDVLTLRIALFEAKYPQKTDRSAFFDELLRRLAQQPGVAA
ncbi:MAG TPA: ABC transporter permease, partial [Thermoanaerobaculia bacterium]|nr:ABC transporter permease [Thermoanaerobaculia bacterium]